jgi:hypothetical protein
MRNTFTTTPNELEEMSDEEQQYEKKIKLEPDKNVLMFISQFAKVYHVENRAKTSSCYISMILN